MPRTPFDEFLNSAGPSTPRGRGRGRGGARGGGGRGGRGGGRGGSFGGVSGQSKLSSDYSNVSFDYSNLNTRTYSKLEGSTVAPFGPADKAQNIQNSSPYSTPRGRGSYTPRGRGRGAFGQQNDAARTTPTGAATPVLGLGYNKNGNPNKFKLDKYDKGKQSDRNGQYTSGPKSHHRSGDTVGKQGVFWGGGAAPIFVKAGELFKDGEVDILKVDKEQNIHVERQPLSDPSAPQMIHLQDRVEVELHPEVLAVGEHPDDMVLPEEVDFWTGVAPINPPEKTTIADLPPTAAPPSAGEDVAIPSGVVDPPIMEQPPLLESKVEKTSEGASEVIQETMIVDDIEVEAPAAVVAEAPIPSEDIPAFFIDTEPGPASAPAESVEGATSASEPLFFVDTGPVTVATEVQYHSLTTDRPLGTQLSDGSKSEEEEIILKPRKFGQPKPISVDTTHAGPSRSTAQPPSKPYDATVEEGFISRSFVPPTQLSRRDKKALKKEKRTRNKVKAKKNKKDGKKRGDVYVGSDVEWGSDGPPDHILSVEMELDDGLDSEKDVEILRDYLAGTLLNEATDSEEEDEEEPGEEKMSFNLIRAMATDGNDQDENFEIESGEEDNPDIESDSEDEDSDEGDSIDEDDDSSDIGEIRFQPISNPAQDSSSDEDDIDAIFNGKDSWDETEWFIKNMEEALDGDVDMGNRKARKSVFRAVEQGNFGDDWDVPTEPYKKGKKKALDPYIPAELHSQWEQDRLRKAEKRRLRDLERLVAILDPHPATHSKKDKGKKKQKGSSRVEQAKLAHLIPASAMEIADMFDVPSDVDEGPGSNSINAKMRKILNELLPGGRGLEGVNEGIRKFMKDDGKSTYSVPPMDKEGRMKVHMLAECYGMTSKSRGKGQARFTVLTKTSRTGVRVDEARIARIISAAPQSGGAFYKAFYKGKGGKTGAKGKKGPIDNGASAKAREGETVGFGAERIGMENIGHKLLSRMGWSEGGRIGRSEGGLEQPIVAIVKTTKMGLGA